VAAATAMAVLALVAMPLAPSMRTALCRTRATQLQPRQHALARLPAEQLCVVASPTPTHIHHSAAWGRLLLPAALMLAWVARRQRRGEGGSTTRGVVTAADLLGVNPSSTKLMMMRMVEAATAAVAAGRMSTARLQRLRTAALGAGCEQAGTPRRDIPAATSAHEFRLATALNGLWQWTVLLCLLVAGALPRGDSLARQPGNCIVGGPGCCQRWAAWRLDSAALS
jgi:hypothetical protein